MKHGEVFDRKGTKVVIASCDTLNESLDPRHQSLTVPEEPYTRIGMMTGATMAGIAAKLREVFDSTDA